MNLFILKGFEDWTTEDPVYLSVWIPSFDYPTYSQPQQNSFIDLLETARV